METRHETDHATAAPAHAWIGVLLPGVPAVVVQSLDRLTITEAAELRWLDAQIYELDRAIRKWRRRRTTLLKRRHLRTKNWKPR